MSKEFDIIHTLDEMKAANPGFNFRISDEPARYDGRALRGLSRVIFYDNPFMNDYAFWIDDERLKFKPANPMVVRRVYGIGE